MALSRTLGSEETFAVTLYTLGMTELHREELERASEWAEEALRLQRALGDTAGVARTLTLLGFVSAARHDYERAMALHEESLALAREAEDNFAIVLSLGVGAIASLGMGDHRRTMMLNEEAFELSRRSEMMRLTAGNLHVVASLAGSQGQPIRAARLWGAAESLLERIGTTIMPNERRFYEPYIAAARAELDEAAWEAAWSEGRAMTPEEAIEYALEVSPPSTLPQEQGDRAGLSERELKVLQLVAEGLTDPQVAHRLSLSPRTVAHHLRSIYRKLGVPSRAAGAKAAVAAP